MSASPQSAELIYDPAAEVVSGTIPGHGTFNMKAYSGGSRGHKHGVNANVAAQYL